MHSDRAVRTVSHCGDTVFVPLPGPGSDESRTAAARITAGEMVDPRGISTAGKTPAEDAVTD
jgi:hypothetical protein